jgi:subtilisin family serine protease
MKVVITRSAKVLAYSIFSMTFIWQAQAAFIGPDLQDWEKAPQNSIKDTTKEVIIFFKEPSFKDRTGVSRAHAISSESAYVEAYLQDKAIQIQSEFAGAPLFITSQKAEVLWSSNAVVVVLDKGSLNRLSKREDIDAIVENKIIILADPVDLSFTRKPEAELTYGLKLINAKAAWAGGVDGKDVIIGVIDTGVDANHPDLVGKVLLTKDFTDDNDNVDYHGHGTHVSGTIAGGDSSGTAIGVAPGAKIIMAKAFNKKGRSSTKTLLAAMQWVLDPDENPETDDAPRVVSNSWGASTQFTYGFRNAIKTWRRFDIFPNFAAGNSGSRILSINAPGSYPYSYAIGAIDSDSKVTKFSSRGPTIWIKNKFIPYLATKPDIMAPGSEVYSAFPDGKWMSMSGTSMATPHIAGVLALMLQVAPDLAISDMIEILNTSTLDKGKKGRDNAYGFGLIQVQTAMEKTKRWQNSSRISFLDKDPKQWEWGNP